MLHKNLTQVMILLWKIQCTKIRTMHWQGSVRILPCGLNSLSAGRVLLQTTPPMTIMKASRNNYKPFMGDSSTLTPSNGFDNQHLQKKKILLPSVFLQAVILHVQTLDPSRNPCFWRQDLIWIQDKLICFRSVTRRRSSCITIGSLWRNKYTKLVFKVVIRILIFD